MNQRVLFDLPRQDFAPSQGMTRCLGCGGWCHVTYSRTLQEGGRLIARRITVCLSTCPADARRRTQRIEDEGPTRRRWIAPG